MRALILITLVGLAFALPAHAQPGGNRFVERLEPYIQKTMSEAKIPGLAIGIVEAGRPVYLRGFGVMDARDSSRPVTAAHTFPYGVDHQALRGHFSHAISGTWLRSISMPPHHSISLISNLKDPRYRSITVRLMLMHRSGMPDVEDYLWDKPEYDAGALERYVRSLQDKSLLWEPGTKFAYSNMAFEVLGDLVAKVSGNEFRDLCEREYPRSLSA